MVETTGGRSSSLISLNIARPDQLNNKHTKIAVNLTTQFIESDY